MTTRFKRLLAVFLLFIFAFTNNLALSTMAAQNTNCEAPYIVEHLPTYKKTSVNIVKVYSNQAIISANNVLKVSFTAPFSSKTAHCGDKIAFVLNDGLVTEEGRQLLPCGSQVIASIQQIDKPQIWNRNAKVYLLFEEIVMPNCNKIPLCGKVLSKDGTLKKSSWAAVGKAAAWTVGLFGVGAGLGAGIGAAANEAGLGCLAFGMPIGAAVGLIIGTVTPGLHYKAKEGKVIYIQLIQDLSVCNVPTK